MKNEDPPEPLPNKSSKIGKRWKKNEDPKKTAKLPFKVFFLFTSQAFKKNKNSHVPFPLPALPLEPRWRSPGEASDDARAFRHLCELHAGVSTGPESVEFLGKEIP